MDEKDIKTTGYNIYPRYEYQSSSAYYPNSGKQTLAAYVVSQNVTVKARKIEDAGKLLSGLGEMGVTNVSGLSFEVDDEDSVIAKAREAISDAREKAKKLAKDLGVSLVRIVSFSDSGNYPIYYTKDSMTLGMGGMAESAPAPSIPIGENQFTSNVSITYEIK